MTKTLNKNIQRSITGSLGRYLAILLIIMLGVAFFAGLKLTRPAMLRTAGAYLEETALYDLRLLSTIGFDEDDVEAASQCSGVTAAEGSVSVDFIWMNGSEELVLSAHMLTETIDRPALIDGRLPEAGNECVLDAENFSSDMIGQTIRIDSSNDEDTLGTFAYEEYTVVGLVDSPLYLSNERGTTSLSSGSVYAFVLIPEEGFDSEYYTELYVKCANFELYSDAYDEFIEELSDAVEGSVALSIQTRFDGLIADAEEEIADAEQELEDEKADAQQELDDAKAELDDAAVELADARQELDDAAVELADALAELEDGEIELADAKAELEEALAEINDGETALDEAKAQLDAALAEIVEGETSLDEAKAQLDAAKAQLDAGAEQIQSGSASWDDALAAGLADYEAGQAQLDAAMEAAEQRLSDSYDQLQTGEASYSAGLEQLKAAQAAYETALAEYEAMLAEMTEEEIEAAGSELTATKETLDATAAALSEREAQLAEIRAALDEGWADYDAGVAELEQQRETQQAALDSAYASLMTFQAGIETYRAGLAEYEAAAQTLAEGRAAYEEGLAEYEAAVQTLAEGRAAYEEGLAEYEDGVQSLSDGWEEYADGLTEYEDGEAEYADGLAGYEDGLAEYEDGLAEFNEEIADAEAEIADARQELAEQEDPTLYVLDRSGNSGYVSFESDSMIVDRIASVLPVFFFLIAALVCSTTMTRMVDDDRTQIGTMRALGYSRGSILSKYIIYSGSAAVIGCLIGYFGGGYLFPMVIMIAYQMIYTIPSFLCVYQPYLLALSMAASLLCFVGVTYLACRHTMLSTPADLIRPKTPSAGKRILLERFGPLWKRLRFLYKVSLRNIFRFKKRMFMMLLGIAGCTALVLTAFGIEDSVAGIGNYQFDDIQKYDLSVTCDDAITDDWLENIDSTYGDQMTADAVTLMSAGELTGSDATKSVYFVVSDDPDITEIISLQLDGETVAYPGDGEIVVSEKLADLAGIKVGDTVVLSIADDEKASVTVAAFTENYVYSYVYMNGDTYAAAFGSYEPKTLLVQIAEDTDEYSLGASLSNEDGVTAVSVVTDIRKSIDNMMQSLNYVVALVLGCAAALAFIVLFNLGNINISERQREIATIKVLGFHARETGSYVFRENIILSCMGIICGLPLGIALHRFVMGQIQVDMVAFKCVIKPISYLYTVILVLLFSIVTDLILRRKIARIGMAESLKSVE